MQKYTGFAVPHICTIINNSRVFHKYFIFLCALGMYVDIIFFNVIFENFNLEKQTKPTKI